MATNERHDNKKTVKEKSRSKVKTKTTISADETLENRFALLCDMEAEQSDDDDEFTSKPNPLSPWLSPDRGVANCKDESC